MKRSAIIIGTLATVFLAAGTVVYAGVEKAVAGHSSVTDTRNIPKPGTAIPTVVTHGSWGAKEATSFGWVGLTITPLNANAAEAKGILPESEALKSTDILSQQFGAKSRNVLLVKASRHLDAAGTQIATLTDQQTQNDPNFAGGKFENIPCYLVTLNGIDIPSTGGKPVNGKAPEAIPDKNTLLVLIDATTGANLFMYAIHK